MEEPLLKMYMPLLLSLSSFAMAWHATSRAGALERERERRAEAREQLAVLRRYHHPLLNATFELQSRIFNILRKDFLSVYMSQRGEAGRRYAVNSTLFVFGQFFGWMELIQRDIQFLESEADAQKAIALSRRMLELRRGLASDRDTSPCRIFAFQQRAIGERMIIASANGDTCMGYAKFCDMLASDPAFAEEFTLLRQELESFARAGSPSHRLTILHTHLIDLLEVLDRDFRHYPKEERQYLQ